MIICLTSLLTGGLLALYAPVGQFVVGLIVITAAGVVTALVAGVSTGRLLPWAAALYVSGQVGYALGVGAIAVSRARRDAGAPQSPGVAPERKPLLK